MCSHYVIFKPCFPEENRHAMLLLRQASTEQKFPKKFKKQEPELTAVYRC